MPEYAGYWVRSEFSQCKRRNENRCAAPDSGVSFQFLIVFVRVFSAEYLYMKSVTVGNLYHCVTDNFVADFVTCLINGCDCVGTEVFVLNL